MKKRFAVWFTEHWNRLAREAVESPVLETFKSHLDTNLSILLWGTLPEQAGRTRLPPMVPSNLTHSVILRKMPSLGRKVKVYNSFYKPPKAVFLSWPGHVGISDSTEWIATFYSGISLGIGTHYDLLSKMSSVSSGWRVLKELDHLLLRLNALQKSLTQTNTFITYYGVGWVAHGGANLFLFIKEVYFPWLFIFEAANMKWEEQYPRKSWLNNPSYHETFTHWGWMTVCKTSINSTTSLLLSVLTLLVLILRIYTVS